MKTLLCMLLPLAIATQAYGKVITKSIDYEQGGVKFEGYLAYDDATQGKRPGVLVVHEWWGLNDYAKDRARQLAELGYVAFAADMYGKGVLAKTQPEAAALAGKLRGNPLMRERMKAAFDVLASQEQVDKSKLAAIGFCFGGTCCLELAYSGADLAGVVTFHGGLTAPAEQDVSRIKARILALHGADDPLVPPAQVKAWEEGMRKAGVDWELIAYGGAVHTFSNPAAGSANKAQGVAYDAKAAARSWQHMQLFFREIFGQPDKKIAAVR
ncbi:MAG TPA: dienelactone hydrolase family protein [Pirellulales bacterium]|jgi:dienelactone hydrolase|nr:dienelactone hydrolase family protein [Pirellulales bacterium]